MTPAAVTPRDRLERLLDHARKATRYWWLVLAATVVGAGASVAFALTRPNEYKSWSTLFYQERIQASVVSGRAPEAIQRDLGDRYRELLLARSQLDKLLADPSLDLASEVARDGADEVIERLREDVELEPRGAGTFRISYVDRDRDRAQGVTQRLTELLQQKEEEIRNDQARSTAAFAEAQKAAATEQLRTDQRALSEFLAKHPEFAADASAGGQEGASIRAAAKRGGAAATGTREQALERQLARIRARLAAPAGAAPTPVRTPRPPSPERVAAEAAVEQARRELAGAERRLEEVRARFTDKHPDVVGAREAVATAQQRVRRAEAAVPPDPADEEVVVAPTSEADRAALEAEAAKLVQQLAAERAKSRADRPTPAAPDDATNWVVELETEYAELRRAVDEQRERVQTLSDSVARAQIDASLQIAEQGSRLIVVDPAFRPTRPVGRSTRMMVLAGLVLFVGIGALLAVAMAFVDDRLYRRAEIDELGLAPVLAVIPAEATARRRRTKERS